MRRIAVVCAVAVLLGWTAWASGAEDTSAGDDRLNVNPFPPPSQEEAEHGAGTVLGEYVGNRFRDLADIVTLRLGWGTDMSLGFQLRLIRPLQIGLGTFSGYIFAVDHGCVGVMKQAEFEGGLSIFYVGYLARKVRWQTKEAERRNIFFNNVGEKGELTMDQLVMYDDKNQGWLTSTVMVELPYLPKVELTLNWGEVPDFLLSVFGVSGFRVPPPFHKIDGPNGERIPAPSSIFWHGQETYESYK